MVYSRFDIIRETTIERVRMYFNSAILVPYFDKKAHSNNDTYCDAGLFWHAIDAYWFFNKQLDGSLIIEQKYSFVQN